MSTNSKRLQPFLGEWVIVRTFSAGVWFGKLKEKDHDEVILEKARRLWQWKAAESISLSAVAVYGVDPEQSIFPNDVPAVWLKAIEIIPASKKAIATINKTPIAEQQK